MTSRPKFRYLSILLALLVLAVFPALLMGAYDVRIGHVFAIIWEKITGSPGGSLEITRVQRVIILGIRAPRVILAITAGMALSISGAAYQGCFRNPLVEPYILGVSSGAACGAALAIIFPALFPGLQLTAFVFALLAVFLSYTLAKNRGLISPVALVLSGIIVGALFTAGVGVMKYLAADAQLREITFWMMGGLYYAGWGDVWISLAAVVPVFALLWFFSWRLNILSLGDEEARSLGVNPGLTRLVIILASTLAASVMVSICGVIAWVGLMTPHAARMILGPDNRWVLPGSAILGAIYLLVCDTAARTLTAAEIPLGIITSILGAPYLLWLLRDKGRELYGH
jgi:iron complex transport system permease protein